MRTRTFAVPIVVLAIAVLAGAQATAMTKVRPEGARTAAEEACFDADRGAGTSDRAAHLQWAQGKSFEVLAENLVGKIDLIARCPAVSDATFADFFADLSVILARAAPDPWCYDGDAGKASTDRAAHRAWAGARARDVVRNDLAQKAADAVSCVSEAVAPKLFADASVSIASAPTAGHAGGAGGPGTGGQGPGGPGPGGPGGGGDGGGDGVSGFQVWVKDTPCSVTREQWISVARQNPSLGLSQFESASLIHPTAPCINGSQACTFDQAMASAVSIRTSPSFSRFCCRDFSVWSNLSTGRKSVVLGNFGSIGPGWVRDKVSLCCEEAAAEAGFTAAFCTHEGGGPDLQDACGPRDWSVWENTTTRKRAAVMGRFGTPGFGWMPVKSELCCPEAAELAGLPPSFCAGVSAGVPGGNLADDDDDDDGITGGGDDDDDGPVVGGEDDGDDDDGPVVAGVRACDASEQALWSKMTGTWDASYGKVTFSGSCENVTGYWKQGEWGERGDELRGEISGGRVSGSSLTFSYSQSWNNKSGSDSCHLSDNNALQCSYMGSLQR